MADVDGPLTAVASGSLEGVESALAAGVSPDAAYGGESIFYPPGTTALVVACLNAFKGDSHCHIEKKDIVKALLRAGANPNPDSGTPPLMYSTMNGNASTTKMLLDAGANALVTQALGWTPLHRACSRSAACVELLLASGADSVVNVQCQNGVDGGFFHPLDLAVKNIVDNLAGRARIGRALPLLLRAGAVCPTPYYSGLPSGDPSLLNPHLDKVIAAGGFRRYEQRHINALAATFGPKLGLLPEMARVVVTFYAHCGFY